MIMLRAAVSSLPSPPPPSPHTTTTTTTTTTTMGRLSAKLTNPRKRPAPAFQGTALWVLLAPAGPAARVVPSLVIW